MLDVGHLLISGASMSAESVVIAPPLKLSKVDTAPRLLDSYSMLHRGLGQLHQLLFFRKSANHIVATLLTPDVPSFRLNLDSLWGRKVSRAQPSLYLTFGPLYSQKVSR